MRILVINADYYEFLRWLYKSNPGLDRQPCAIQRQQYADTLFGMADFYSESLRQLGHEAYEVTCNNDPIQRQWMREHDQIPPSRWNFRLRKGILPWVSRQSDWRAILAAQIRHYKPDVLINHAMPQLDADFLRGIKDDVGLLVGQHAATQLSSAVDWSVYDLVVSSFMPTVDWLRGHGVKSELLLLGFDPRVLSALAPQERTVPLSFIGSFYDVHRSRTALLEQLAERFPLQVWGAMPPNKLKGSPLKSCYQGTAWGRDMFAIMARSQITINHHGEVPPYANNMRLYEATGCGTLLVTDWKPNLPKIFEPGKEVIAYRDANECIQAIEHYSAAREERERIALAGQKRTLQDHTYRHRMEEFIEIVCKYL